MLDHAGQPMTAASAAAVAAYEDFLDAYGRFSPTVPDALKATLAADPEMPLAWCARGALMMLGQGRACPWRRPLREQGPGPRGPGQRPGAGPRRGPRRLGGP